MILKSVVLMEVLFQEHLDLIEETKRISDKCNVTIDTGHYLLPKYSDEIDSLEGYLEMVRDDELEKRKVENEIKLYTDKLVDTYKLYYRIYDVING